VFFIEAFSAKIQPTNFKLRRYPQIGSRNVNWTARKYVS